MKKLLIGVIAIAALLIAGKFGLEHHYKKKLDQLISQGSIFIDASYDKLFIDMQGGLNVTNISIAPKSGDQVDVNIKKFRLFSSDRTMLIKGFESIQDGQFPEIFETSVEGFNFDSSSTQKINDARECRYIEEPLRLDNFTDSNISIDFKLKFETEGEELFKIKWDSIHKGITSLDAEFLLDKSLLKSPLSAGSGKDLPIRNLKVTNFFNTAYSTKALEYCAEKLKLTTTDYLENVIGSDNYYKVLKFIPSVELKEAIKMHFSGQNSLTFTAKPNATARNINQLKLYKPTQIIKALNLTITADDEKITPIVSDRFFVENTGITESEKTVDSANNSSLTKKPATKKYYGKRQFSYEEIQKRDAKKYIGKTVKIYRKKRLIKGELLKADNTKVQVNNKSYGGSSIMSLPLNEINKIEVKIFK